MPVSCEGALILELYKLVVLMKKHEQDEIRILKSSISEKERLIDDLDKRATVLLNAHVAMGCRKDPEERGMMEFKNNTVNLLML